MSARWKGVTQKSWRMSERWTEALPAPSWKNLRVQLAEEMATGGTTRAVGERSVVSPSLARKKNPSALVEDYVAVRWRCMQARGR